MDKKFNEFEEALSNYHHAVSGKSAARRAAEDEASALVAQMHILGHQRDAALLSGDDDQAATFDQQIDDLTGKVRLLQRRAALLADQVNEHDPVAAALVVEVGRGAIEAAQEEIAKRMATLEQKRDLYAREVETFTRFIRRVAGVRFEAVKLMAQAGGDVSTFPRTTGYGPARFMPRLPETFDANTDPAPSMFRNLPELDEEATYGSDRGDAESEFVPGSESLVPIMPTERNMLTDDQLATLEGPRWLQEI